METINHEYYVSLEVAKLLKQAGFDWKCNLYFSELSAPKEAGIFDAVTNKVYGVFDSTILGIGNPTEDDILRPTLDVAQRWLREVKGYSIYPTYGGYKIYVLDINDSAGFSRTYGLNSNLTYEEAQEVGEKKALEIILEKGE